MSGRARAIAVSVAPMMDRSDRHFRALMRMLSRRVLLYTEMITARSIVQGEAPLQFHPLEHPVALQLGGEDPAELTRAAKIAEDFGYDEINLNCGCPSDRVKQGNFGARLMARPERVAEAVAAMRAAVRVPVTVKHRIGIDGLDRYEDMANFVDVVASAGCDRFIVHARMAMLHGPSPRENRSVPPLRPAEVYRLKAERSALLIEYNGGVRTLEAAKEHLRHVDGVMIGRLAFEDPFALFSAVDREVFGEDTHLRTRSEAIEGAIEYAEAETRAGVPVHAIARHLVPWFVGQVGASRWRRYLSEEAARPGAGASVIREALVVVAQAQSRSTSRVGNALAATRMSM